jgi:rhamnose utilization protein RhaD (predicted bifunctional aldolase and dehydrogenase)
MSYFFNRTIAAFMSRKDAAKLLAKGPLGAAELVYAGGPPMWVEKTREKKIAAKLTALLRKGHQPPTAFVVRDIGLFVAADKKNASAVAEVATSSLKVRIWASRLGGIAALTRKEQDFIKRWYSSSPLQTK